MTRKSFARSHAEDAQEMIYDGYTASEVARFYGVSRTTVLRCTQTVLFGDRKARLEDVAIMTRQGLTTKEIAERVRITERSVTRLRKKAREVGL